MVKRALMPRRIGQTAAAGLAGGGDRSGIRKFAYGSTCLMRNSAFKGHATRHSAPAPESEKCDDIVSLASRLTGLASRIAGISRGGRPVQADATGRVWPELEAPRAAHASTPEAVVAAPPSEVAERDLVIADLTGQQLARADDLRTACAQIDDLVATIYALRLERDRRDRDLAEATQQLIEVQNENSDLVAALSAERQKNAALSRRSIDAAISLNNQMVEVNSDRETADKLAQELAIARIEVPKAVATAEVRAHRLFAEQLARLSERHEQQVNELRAALAERERQTALLEKPNPELAMLFCALSNRIAVLETESAKAAGTIRAQAGQIEFLEAASIVERQNAEATIKELAAEFGRERDQLLAREKSAAEIRKNIVQLLPKLIARRDAAGSETGAAQVA